MFGTIRKHQKWLWGVIITLTIISFVIFFQPTNKLAKAGGEGATYFGTINGETIDREKFFNAEREIYLQYFFLSGGNWYNEQDAKKANFDVYQRTYARLLLIQKEQQFGIHISSEVAAQFATQMLHQFDRGGNPITPQIFQEKVLKERGLSLEDWDRFVRHELGIQELMSTAGISG